MSFKEAPREVFDSPPHDWAEIHVSKKGRNFFCGRVSQLGRHERIARVVIQTACIVGEVGRSSTRSTGQCW